MVERTTLLQVTRARRHGVVRQRSLTGQDKVAVGICGRRHVICICQWRELRCSVLLSVIDVEDARPGCMYCLRVNYGRSSAQIAVDMQACCAIGTCIPACQSHSRKHCCLEHPGHGHVKRPVYVQRVR
jgi:hypothetical protein